MPAAAAAVATWIAAHAGAVFTMAALAAVSLVSADRMKMSPREDPGRPGQLVNTCDNRIPLPLVYGRTRLGINRVYACVTGEDNKYLHLVGNICEGPVKGIYEIDGVPQIFLGDKLYTEYGDKFYYEFFRGTSDQAVCSTLATATAGEAEPWNEPKHYTAYIYCRFEYDPDVFQGLPDVTMVIEGMEVYNPTTEVTEYTRNPALHALDYMTRSSKRGGMQIGSARVDTDLIESAASYCDTKGWTCDICLRDESSAIDHFQGILNTFRGDLIYSDSIFQLKYRDLNYESPVMDLTEHDVVEQGASTLRIEQPSIFNTPNAVRCRYINEEKKYTFDDFILSDSVAIAADGDYREQVAEFPGMLNPSNVAKMAAYLLERARLNKTASLVIGSRGMALEPHDLITLTHSWPGWDEKIMRVSGASISYDGNVALSLEEEYASFYDDDYEITPEMFYDTTLPDPRAAIPSVINVSHAEETYYYRGRTFTRWRINFDRPTLESYPFWDYAEVWVKIGEEEATVNLIATQGNAAQDWTAWIHWSTGATTYWASQGTFNDPDYGVVWWGIGTSKSAHLYDYSPYTLLQGQTLTFSIYLKADEEITLPRPRFYTRRADTTSDIVDHDPVSVTLTPEWQRFTWTTTIPADAKGIGVSLCLGVLDGKKIYAAYPQLEEKPFATSFVNGSRGEWAFATKSQGDYVLDPVEEGETYYVNIVGVSIFGGKQAFGEGYQVSTTIQGMSGLPSDVAWMTAVAHGDSVSIYAPELNEPDVFGYEVRMGAAFDGGVVVGFNETPNFRLSGVAPGTKTFWMKAKNNAGFYSENAVSAQVVVFYPSGYTAKNTWSWDYSTGTHDNTEQHEYSGVDSLRCAHTGNVLSGTWTSPKYDLGSVKDVRIWGDFITDLQSTDGLWESVFGEGDLWGDRISEGQKWYQVFAPSTTGHLEAVLYYGDTSGNLTNSIDRFEMFSPEVSARYVQVEITITDPALDVYTYVNKLNMTAAFWRDTP